MCDNFLRLSMARVKPMTSLKDFSTGVCVPLIVACPMVATTAAAQAPASQQRSAAHAARVLDGTDTAHLRLVQQDETRLYEEGSVSGALPGHMRAQLTVGSAFTGRCTIYTTGGSITGSGRAAPHGFGRYQSFKGSLLITGGSGRYAHVRGRTQLYGTFDRRTFSVVLQTVGKLSY